MRGSLMASAFGISLSAVFALSGVGAQAADFYKGRTITMLVSFGAGGGYGLYARTLGQHMGKHIPGNPTIIMQFMTGAGGNKAANYFYNVSARDGSVLAHLSNALALFQVLQPSRVKYDASKLNYLGRMASMRSSLITWHTSPATTLEDFRKKELIFGATGRSGQDYMNPTLMKNILGFKARVVTGYKGSRAINNAMEKGEVHAMANSWGSVKSRLGHWLDQKKIVPLAIIGLSKEPSRPDLPLVMDLAQNKSDRDILELMASTTAVGRAFTTTPAVPADRIELLRAAMAATMKDPAFLKDTTKRKMDLDYVSGPDLQTIVNKTIASSPKLIASFKKAVDMK